MSLLIQNYLISWILQPLANISNRIPKKFRNSFAIICGVGIFFLNIVNNTWEVSLRYLYICAANSLMIGMMLFCTLPEKISPIKFDKILMIPWMGVTVFMLIAGVTKAVDYLADAMLLLVMFPVIFLVWNNGDFTDVVKLFINIVRVVAIVFFIVSIIFFPITDSKYSSCFSNEGNLSFFLTTFFSLFLVSFVSGKKRSVICWLDLALMGICWALIYYTNNRTGQIACVMITGCALLILLVLEKQRMKCLLLDVLPVVLMVAISVQVVLPVFTGIHNLYKHCENAIVAFNDEKEQVSSVESTVPSVESTDPGVESTAPGVEQTSPATDPTSSGIASNEVLEKIENIQTLKTETEGKTLNLFLTGRIDIWKGVFEHVTFWGHPLGETFTYTYREGTREHTTAHMTILDLAYRHGFLAGVFHLLFNLFAGVKSIVFAVRHPKERYFLAPFAITIAYGCISSITTVDAIYSFMITLLYYLMQTPLMMRSNKSSSIKGQGDIL